MNVPGQYNSLPYPLNFEKALDDDFPMDMDGEMFMKARSEGFEFHMSCPVCGLGLCLHEYVFFGGCAECIVKND